MLLQEDVKRPGNRTEKRADKVDDIDRCLVRVETPAELSMKRLPGDP